MACEYCGRLVGHDCRCPNYEIPNHTTTAVIVVKEF